MAEGSDTKTSHLVDKVFRAILHGEYAPGGKVPGEREMAAITQTSRITVRRAYARLEEVGILERRHGSGTYVASHNRGAVDHVGIVGLLAARQFTSGVFGVEFLNAFELAVFRAGQLLTLRLTDVDRQEDESAAISLVSHQVRNLVIWPGPARFDESTFARLRVLGVNMVFFDLFVPGSYADFVGLDNAHAVKTLVAAATARGNRFLIFVAHSDIPSSTNRERQAAFLRCCADRGLSHRVVAVPWRGDVEGTLRGNAAAWFGGHTHLGVLCVNDGVAMKVRAIAGPNVDVYGIDGLPEAVAAGVITYRQPFSRMAQTALALIRRQQQMGGKWTARQVRCRGEILKPQSPCSAKLGQDPPAPLRPRPQTTQFPVRQTPTSGVGDPPDTALHGVLARSGKCGKTPP